MRRRALLCATAAVGLAGCLFADDGHPDLEDCEIDGHESGEIEIVVDGEPIDLEPDRYQAEHAADFSYDFHFHEGTEAWYMDCDRVTFAEAIDLIPHFSLERRDGDFVLGHDDERYDASEGDTAIEFVLNGASVDPGERRLHDGDALAVEVTMDG